MLENNKLDGATETGLAAQTLEAARCLKQYLDTYGKQGRTFDVLRFLAENTITRLSGGQDAKFSNQAIQGAVVGKVGTNPSGWINPIWTSIVSVEMPAREQGLRKFALDNGFTVFPGVRKIESAGGAGNTALYCIDPVPLPALYLETIVAADQTAGPGGITYIPELHPAPAWWVRWLFNREFGATGWRKWFYLLGPIAWLVILLLAGLALWFSWARDKGPFSPQDTLALMLFGWLVYQTRASFLSFGRLVDDRIAMAPEHFESPRLQ